MPEASGQPFRLEIARPAARAIADGLPEAVALRRRGA